MREIFLKVVKHHTIAPKVFTSSGWSSGTASNFRIVCARETSFQNGRQRGDFFKFVMVKIKKQIKRKGIPLLC